jgi:hypothetical protein
MKDICTCDYDILKTNIHITVNIHAKGFPPQEQLHAYLNKFKPKYCTARDKIRSSSDFTSECIKMSTCTIDFAGRGNLGTTAVLEHDRTRDAMVLRWWEFAEDNLHVETEVWKLEGNRE